MTLPVAVLNAATELAATQDRYTGAPSGVIVS